MQRPPHPCRLSARKPPSPRYVPDGSALFSWQCSMAAQSVSGNCGGMARLVEEPARFVNTSRPRSSPHRKTARALLSSRHDVTRLRLLRNHARGAAARLCLRNLPDGGERRRSDPVLARAGTARRDSVRRLSRRLPPGAHGALRCLHRHRRYRVQGGDRRLRGAAARPRRHLDQQAHPGSLSRAVHVRPLPQRRGLAGRQSGRRALWRQPRPRLLRREHVSHRARRIEGRAGASGGPIDRRRVRTIARCSTRRSLARRRNSSSSTPRNRSRVPTRWRSSPRAIEFRR
jgi:hypothetical protein